ncbi:hypothetical protein [Streptomyces chumphonensis]|uniref:hypothetical protein n=1 Tax=Streptomyces chumphonensis TaxID=1214925 RepID=UPI003D70AB7B
MGKRRVTGAGVAALAGLCASAVLSGPAVAVGQAEDAGEALPTYAMAEDARPVEGTASSSGGPELRPGLSTDSIGPGEERFYSVTLDDTSTVYLAATAAPRPGAEVRSFGEKLSMRLLTVEGDACDTAGSATFGTTSAYPVSGYAARRVGGGIEECQEAGPYLFQVVRESPEESDQARWPIEIGYHVEPGLEGAVPGPPGGSGGEEPKAPTPPSGTARQAKGGTGFNDAGAVADGVWRDGIRAGESRFYRVPVDWGQQLFARLEVPNAAVDGDGAAGFVSDAFSLQLYNPARAALTDSDFETYSGEQAAMSLAGGVVDYGNRFADEGRGRSIAGWHYLQVTFHRDMAAHFPDGADVTLRVTVDGAAQEAPAYVSDALPAGFGVTDEDREAAEQGLTAAEAVARRDGGLRLLAYGAFGTGTALLLGLGAWWLVGRRRPVASGAPPVGVGPGYGYPPQGYGPPGTG